MSHRDIRCIIHDVCDEFYARIKDMDGTEAAWEKVSQIAEEYRIKHNDSRFAKDLILAVVGEVERNWEGRERNGKENRQ